MQYAHPSETRRIEADETDKITVVGLFSYCSSTAALATQPVSQSGRFLDFDAFDRIGLAGWQAGFIKTTRTTTYVCV